MKIISHPVLCNYYLTYRCNAKCDFCDIWERPSPFVSMEQVKNNLMDLKKIGVKVIDFTGGEPLLHKDIADILLLAKGMGFITTVTTNAILYPRKAESLKGLIDMLHFSLDSFSREEHDRLRGVNCYDKVIESIEVSARLGERPDILFTVFEDNLGQIEKVYEEICVPNNLMLLLNPAFSYNDITATLSENAMKNLLSWGKKKLVYLNEAFIELRRQGGNHIENPVCKAASTTLVISPDNELVLPCYHLGIKSYPITGKLYELYYSREVQQLVKLEGTYDQCEGCTINCYMQPSFSVEVNRYFWKALGSTLKYSLNKGAWKNLL